MHLDPNTLSVHWRIALGAAHDALRAGAEYPGAGPLAAELRRRSSALTHERDDVQRLLERDARVEHIPLVRRLSFPHVHRTQLGLPHQVQACVFELDGVLTPSAELHYAAWASVLDDFLVRHFARASVHLGHFARLSRRTDYGQYLHGRPRIDGLRAFLASRGLTLPEDTILALADAKDRALRALLAQEGIEAYAGAVRYLEALAGSGLACAVVSASANTRAILEHAELVDLVDLVVDGATMQALGLRPKPAADLLVAACEQLDVPPASVAAFETTRAGVDAARAAGAGFVVSVASWEPADQVVADLGELLRVAA